MAQLHPLIKLDKDIAESVFGHQPGRPTISRRAGRPIGKALGIGTQAGTDLFHIGLVAGLVAIIARALKKN